MGAPWSGMVCVGAPNIMGTLIVELFHTAGGWSPLASLWGNWLGRNWLLVTIRTIRKRTATRASKLASLVAPITKVTGNVPTRIFIGGVVTILAWNIAFEGCPRLLLHLGFVVDQLRNNGLVYIRDRIGEDAALPRAGGRAGLPHLGEEPASALSLCSSADHVVEIVLVGPSSI